RESARLHAHQKTNPATAAVHPGYDRRDFVGACSKRSEVPRKTALAMVAGYVAYGRSADQESGGSPWAESFALAHARPSARASAGALLPTAMEGEAPGDLARRRPRGPTRFVQ